MLCALIATGMLYCGHGDFRPVNDFSTHPDRSLHMELVDDYGAYTRGYRYNNAAPGAAPQPNTVYPQYPNSGSWQYPNW